MFFLNFLSGTSIGDIHITVYKTLDNKQFFYLKADNKDLLPVLDYLDKSLYSFKTNES